MTRMNIARRGVRIALGVAVAGALLLTAPALEAGIYRCTDDEGHTVFTSDAGACPNARPHVLKGAVQKVVAPTETAASRAARQAPAARAGDEQPDGFEAMWRRKRGEAEQKLKRVEASWTQIQSMIKGCNRGGQWYRKDEAGIRKHVPCAELGEKRAELEKERDALKEYLRAGLEDECRRANCLPGWVR